SSRWRTWSLVSLSWTCPCVICPTCSDGTYTGLLRSPVDTDSPLKMSSPESPTTSSTEPTSSPSASTTFQPASMTNQETGSPELIRFGPRQTTPAPACPRAACRRGRGGPPPCPNSRCTRSSYVPAPDEPHR